MSYDHIQHSDLGVVAGLGMEEDLDGGGSLSGTSNGTSAAHALTDSEERELAADVTEAGFEGKLKKHYTQRRYFCWYKLFSRQLVTIQENRLLRTLYLC